MRIILLLLTAAALAAPLHAQRAGEAPRRPALAAEADTNDARAYYRLGRELLLAGRDADAARAFYWAAQIEPGWADPLYARYVALLMSQPRRLAQYLAGEPRTLADPEVMRIDSLYLRALRMDPFVQRPFERELAAVSLRAMLAEYGGMSRHAADDAAAQMLRHMPPLLRGRVLAGEGQLVEALRAYDEALRDRRGRHAESRRHVRHERARMFALVGNDSAALDELRQAIEAAVEGERDEVIRPYDSKAILEHSRGLLHERLGDPAAARQAYAAAAMEDLGYHPAHVRLGLLAIAEGDTAAALSEMDLAARAAGAEPSVLYTYGALLGQLARLDEAAAQLARAAELAPFYADPWFALGVVRDGQGDLAAARQAYREFLARASRGHRRRAAAEKRLRDLDAQPALAPAEPAAEPEPEPAPAGDVPAGRR